MYEPPPAEKKPGYGELVLSGLPTIALSLFGIIAVHKLTRGREHEKAVFDQHKLLHDQAVQLREAVRRAWTAPIKADRLAAINETKWRLQQVGGTAERIRVLSRRVHWKLGWPLRSMQTISMRDEMAVLRRTLTDDPFEDPRRGPRQREAAEAEDAIGVFMAALEPKVRLWLAPGQTN